MNMAEDIEVKPIRNDLEVVAFRVSGQDFCFDLTSVRNKGITLVTVRLHKQEHMGLWICGHRAEPKKLSQVNYRDKEIPISQNFCVVTDRVDVARFRLQCFLNCRYGNDHGLVRNLDNHAFQNSECER